VCHNFSRRYNLLIKKFYAFSLAKFDNTFSKDDREIMYKNQNILTLWAVMALIAMTGWFGCAATTKIHGIKPAEVSMGGIRTLAVLKFDGKYGEVVRGDFYNKLGEVHHFNLIDTTQINALDKVLYDQVDDPRFLPILNDLHADGVITGRVTANLNDISGTDQVQMKEGTGQYKKEKNIFGNWVDVEIKKTVLRPLCYVIRQASLTTDFKVFDLRTKGIVATGKVTENYNEKFGGDREYAFLGRKMSQLPAKNQTLNELSAKVSAQLVAKISPTEIVKVITFDDGSKYGLGIGGHKLVKRGIEYAKRGAWEEAMEIWQDVIKAEPNNSAAYYNIGMAYESFGDLKNLETARSMYKKAATCGDSKLYIQAVARVQAAIKDSLKYEEQKKLLKQTPVKKSEEGGGLRIY